MALVILDRVKETTTTAGAGTITLLGAATGFQAFSAVGNANTTYYCIASQTLNEWEVGVGTYTLSGTTLARTQILASSNSGSVVTFSAGTKDVFVTYPAGYSVSQADTGTAPNQIPLNQYLGTMAFEDANSVNIQGGLVQNATISPANVTAYQLVANSYPSTPPSLMLDFANSKTLDPRITFTRASTATYYDGVTNAVAEQNLFTYSDQFDNAAWSKTNSTVTANSVVAPDGTTTADTLTASSTAATVCVIQGIQNVVGQTVSVYAKAGTSSFLGVQVYNSASWANFNLSTGAVASSSGCTASVVSVGNSWYRCIVANTTNGALNVVIAGKDADPGVAPYNNGNMTSGNTIYLWGAQVEIRASATAYTPTTTAAITNYIPVLQTAASGVARLDYNPTTGESLGLLIEESRVNLLTYSSDFTNAAWTKTNSTITTAADIAPDGTQTASMLVESTATGGHQVTELITAVTSTAYTATVYVKAAGRSYIALYANNPGVGKYFDLVNGVVLGNFIAAPTTATITSVGNGWYRCSMTATSTSTAVTGLNLYLSTDGITGVSYLGNGYSGVFVWGAQLEAGAFATSYIPTVASQVTRAADAASMTGTNFSSWYNVGQGTLYGEGDTGTTSNALLAVISDGSTSNLLGIGHTGSTNTANSYYNLVLQTNFGSLGVVWNINTVGKVILSLSSNNSNAACNGVAGTVDTVCTMPSNLTRLDIGSWVSVSGVQPLNGHIKRITYYPVALTSTQLVTLTT